MPYYEVQITRSVLHVTTITVEADDEDDAKKTALEAAENNVDAKDRALEWEFEDETFEVDNIDEVDEPPEDEEDEEDEDESEDDKDEEDTAA